MDASYRNAIADHGAGLINYIGLVDDDGTEISDEFYERKPVTWTSASDGLIRPTGNIEFAVAAETVVGGWRGFSAASGGTNYGGHTLPTETYTNDGFYRLLADQTSIQHNS